MIVKAKDMGATVPALLFDPQYYVYDIAIKSDLTKFLIVEESNLALSPFIDNRFEPFAQGYLSVSTKELFSLESQHDIQRPKPAYIFHHAFVCSTLLARCLNEIDAFFSLKEPWILRRLADFKRARGAKTPDKVWRQMFTNYNRLLAKNYRTGTAPVIKATNVANNLIIDLRRFLPDSPILYLYSDLESFLVSNLKKNQETQQKMPGLARGFLTDSNFSKQFPEFCDVDRQTLLQTCALIWATNLYSFKTNLAEPSNQSVKTLLADVFLADTKSSLEKLSIHFGHQVSDPELEQMVAEHVTGTNAKQQEEAYNKEAKAREAEITKSQHQNEIDRALNWIGPLANDLGLLEFMESHRL